MKGTALALSSIEPVSSLAEARRLGRRGVSKLLGWQALRVALRLGFSGCLAVTAGGLIMGSAPDLWIVAALPLLLAAASIAGHAAESSQAQIETGIANSLRGLAARRLAEMPARALQSLPVGTTTVGVQRHPMAIAALVVGHKVARDMLAIGPIAAAVAMLLVSWQAALTVVGLTPVLILFFVLLGGMIRNRAEAQERSFGRLASQFADRIRTLPTILANHALGMEEAKLSARLRSYADNTVRVLSVAFLNAAVIDFFASLSIAILAVFLGLGHLKLAMIPGFSGLELWQSLFILMVAPEYFAAFRRYSEQYHAKAEGEAAATAFDTLLNAKSPAAPGIPAVDKAAAGLDLSRRGLTAIIGPSGSGKTTALRRIAGIERADANPAHAIIWVGTDSYLPNGTLADAIAWGTGCSDRERITAAAGAVGLLDDTLLPGGLDAEVGRAGGQLSGGQRLRIAMARAALSDSAVMADEPTAKLDPVTAAAVRALLAQISASRPVIVATHDSDLAGLADLSAGGRLEEAA